MAIFLLFMELFFLNFFLDELDDSAHFKISDPKDNGTNYHVTLPYSGIYNLYKATVALIFSVQ